MPKNEREAMGTKDRSHPPMSGLHSRKNRLFLCKSINSEGLLEDLRQVVCQHDFAGEKRDT